jgi:NTE family protein
MAITLVQKSPSGKKKNPTVALVLSGGAISGGAFKTGGLIALDMMLKNYSVMDCDMYLGISAGSFLAAPLAAGIPPRESLRSFAGTSDKLSPFGASTFYWPNVAEVVEKGGSALHELATIYPRLVWTVLRLVSKGGPLAMITAKRLLKKKSLKNLPLLEKSMQELEQLYEQLPSLASFVPTGVFDNSRIESYIRKNFERQRIPNNFALLEAERGKRLYIHAVDLDTAGDVIFGPDERHDVTISQAVKASTALPGFYRPARINGRYYIDGNARKTAPLELATQKGADLTLCYNPFKPFHHAPAKRLSAKYSSLGDMGMAKVLDQSIRTLLHSRLDLAVEDLRNDPTFKGDIMVLEPADSDADFFSINPLAFWKRAEAAKHGFITVARDVERNFVRIREFFARYDLDIDLAQAEFVAEKLKEAAGEEEIAEILTSPPMPPAWRRRNGLGTT